MLGLNLVSVSIDEFLQRVGSHPDGNIWSAIVVNPSDFEEVVEDLKDTISIFADCEVEIIFGGDSVQSLVNQIQQTTADYLLLYNFENWQPNNWYEFDYLRSRLDKSKRGGVLILSPESVKAMFTHAPNFVSWIGSRVFTFNKGNELLNDEEREARLATLREEKNLSDADVIKLAEAHKLFLDPEYGEWLILLGREDLIER
jgi:hypothetical protein